MNKTSESNINYLSDFLRDLFKYWYVVLISLMLTLGIALFYIKYSAKTYKVTASVLLKTERSNAFGTNSDEFMRVYDLIEQDKNLQNEIYFFKSSPLIRSVIEDMDLHVSYYLQEDKIPKGMEFSMKDLYQSAPFIVIPDKGHLQPVGVYFYINIVDEENYLVSATNDEAMIMNLADESVALASTPFHIGGTYKFGEEVGNSFVSFRIILNSNYNADQYLGKDLFFMFNTNSSLTSIFQKSLDVEASAIDATMVQMTFNCDNSSKGVDFLNGLINKYIDNNLEEKNFLANKTIEHLDYQLADISESLGSSEEELQNIRRSTSVMNIDEKASNIYNQLQTSQAQKDEIERTLNYLMQMEDYFSSNRDSTGLLAPSAMGLDDPLLNGLIQELTTLNAERQQIINNNQLRSPRLRTLEITIGNLKNVILENLQYSIRANNAELSDVNSKIRDLNREFSSLPYTQRRLLGIERKFNLSENVYMSLLEQRIQAQIIKASTLPDLEIVEPPQFESISAPKRIVLMVAALFVGILIPALFVLSKRLFTSKILTMDELREYTGLTQVGIIPQSSRNTINVIADQPNSIAAEAFHTLRSNIIYYLMGKRNQVILVTSTMEGEGKSFTALNIASSLAVTNNRTLLIEFDLRQPSELYSKLGIRGLVGISSLLIGKAELEEITITSEVKNLDIILAGQIPPNPIELISSSRTEQLFQELREKYDYIVVDTPPYGVLTDSFVMMKYADIKIYVARLKHVKKRMLLSSIEDIKSKGIENVQLLINGESPKQRSYGKYYTNHGKTAEAVKKKRNMDIRIKQSESKKIG